MKIWIENFLLGLSNSFLSNIIIFLYVGSGVFIDQNRQERYHYSDF